MAEEAQRPIIIKKGKKCAHAHHGGAWKVAYADFVTAMMAFFLLLWLLNAVTEEQLSGISNYFAPTTVSRSNSGAGGVLGGKVIGQGASSSNSASPSVVMTLPPPSIGEGSEGTGDPTEKESKSKDEKDDAAAAARQEQKEFEKTAEKLREAMEQNPDLKQMKRNLLIDNTAEGLRIQLLDQEGMAMFPSGSSAMFNHTKKLLSMIAEAISQMPEKVAISGHTDSIGFTDPSGYTNWELSADRALAARRVLVDAGFPQENVMRVVGRADTEPLMMADPADPRNRRLGIVLLRAALSVPAPGLEPAHEPPHAPEPAKAPAKSQPPARH